jgi:hypothetical protein
MKQAVKSILVLALTLTLGSCENRMNGEQYMAFVKQEESGCLKQVAAGSFLYSIQYKPSEYILYSEGLQVGDSLYDQRKKDLKGTIWLNVAFKLAHGTTTPLKYNVSSYDEYNQRLNYYLGEAAKDVRLVYGARELAPISYHFETNYGLTPQETMVLGFALPDNEPLPTKDFQLALVDKVFNNGIIKATFLSETLQALPAVSGTE